MIIMMVCVVLSSLPSGETAPSVAQLGFLCLGAVGCILYPASILILNPYLISRRLMKNTHHGTITYKVNPDRLHVTSSQIDNRVDWSTFNKAMETKRYYFLVLAANRSLFEFVPKRTFTSPHQEAQFRDYVTQLIGPIK